MLFGTSYSCFLQSLLVKISLQIRQLLLRACGNCCHSIGRCDETFSTTECNMRDCHLAKMFSLQMYIS